MLRFLAAILVLAAAIETTAETVTNDLLAQARERSRALQEARAADSIISENSEMTSVRTRVSLVSKNVSLPDNEGKSKGATAMEVTVTRTIKDVLFVRQSLTGRVPTNDTLKLTTEVKYDTSKSYLGVKVN